VRATEGLAARILAAPAEVAAGLDPAKEYWGFYTTPTAARLLRASQVGWSELARAPHLQELRVFGADRDLHWRGDRGVVLTTTLAAEATDGVAGGSGWWQRDRRSRLWGELLEGTETWYEERIPDPQRYEGLPASRYAFLVYREYVEDGVIRYVRYIDVQGDRDDLA
jgi:hypothetical protein